LKSLAALGPAGARNRKKTSPYLYFFQKIRGGKGINWSYEKAPNFSVKNYHYIK